MVGVVRVVVLQQVAVLGRFWIRLIQVYRNSNKLQGMVWT